MSKLRVLDLFAGQGGFSLGLERTGQFETVAFCEIDPFAQQVLARHWPGVPCHADVTTIEHSGTLDLVTGGFPCQDASLAGKGAGITGERTGLFWHILRTVRLVGQPKLLLENVAALLDRGMGAVLGALAQIGYDSEWNCVPACAVGAPHERDRLWIVADASQAGQQRPVINWSTVSGSNGAEVAQFGKHRTKCGDEWAEGFAAVSMGDGISSRLVRGGIETAGNAVVPQIPELIGRAILDSMVDQREPWKVGV